MKKVEKIKSTTREKKRSGPARSKKALYPLRAAGFFLGCVLCIAYFFIVLAYGTIRTSVIWIWPAGGVFFALLGFVFLFFGGIPKNLVCICTAVLISAAATAFCVFEAALIAEAGGNAPDGADCIIILGAAVKGDQPSKALHSRILAAYKYLEKNPDTVAVLSGGRGDDEDISEAECMYRTLSSMGIDPSRLILEDKSRDTAENIRYSLDIIGEKYESIAIVTSNFHIFRAIRLLKKQTDIPAWSISASFDSPLIVHFAVREFIGIVRDTLRGYI